MNIKHMKNTYIHIKIYIQIVSLFHSISPTNIHPPSPSIFVAFSELSRLRRRLPQQTGRALAKASKPSSRKRFRARLRPEALKKTSCEFLWINGFCVYHVFVEMYKIINIYTYCIYLYMICISVHIRHIFRTMGVQCIS